MSLKKAIYIYIYIYIYILYMVSLHIQSLYVYRLQSITVKYLSHFPPDNSSTQPTSFMCNVRCALRLCSFGKLHGIVLNQSTLPTQHWQDKMSLLGLQGCLQGSRRRKSMMCRQSKHSIPYLCSIIQGAPMAKPFRSSTEEKH